MKSVPEKRFKSFGEEPDLVNRFMFEDKELKISVVANNEKKEYQPNELDKAVEQYLRLRGEGVRVRLTIKSMHDKLSSTVAMDDGKLLSSIIIKKPNQREHE